MDNTHASLFVVLLLMFSAVIGRPFLVDETRDPDKPSLDSLKDGDACSGTGRMANNDNSCTPWCVCRLGRVACAHVFCQKEELPAQCSSIHVNGRCCSAVACSHPNGTVSATYHLPFTLIPPDLFAT
ncbi:hypothetical protein BV898_04829 [Hypsibius exemplaris]|uniref:VWFC domain-containing protein n=1 Tax=Hypsibius exemplaris TaxID=2072580 RepID=A0A1W0X0T7_HYPEX|nr:hypothetical protein BV898_04829 [Hypsibius exemplaris]